MWLKSYKMNSHFTRRLTCVYGLFPLIMAIIKGLLSVSHALRPKKQLLYADAVFCELCTEVKVSFENQASMIIDGASVAKTQRNLLLCVKVFSVFSFPVKYSWI